MPERLNDRRALATILAALRYYQRDVGRAIPCEIDDIATDLGEYDSLTAAEIDDLCEMLNLSDFRLPS